MTVVMVMASETVMICDTFCQMMICYWLAVWLSGYALASINVVVLRQTWLVPGMEG